MPAKRSPGTGEPDTTPPAAETAGEALARARAHGRAAAAEALLATHALLDAATLATRGAPSDAHRVLSPVAAVLGGLAEALSAPGASGGPGAPLLDAVADALDVEIARWEARARDDADARAVLRAFLGVRELLWELGVRRRSEGPPPDGSRPPRSPRPPKGRPRVERVPVEG